MEERATKIQQLFAKQFIKVKRDWISECIVWIEKQNGKQSNDQTLFDLMYQQFLVSDLSLISTGNTLPQLSKMHNQYINEVIILQIDELWNMTQV